MASGSGQKQATDVEFKHFDTVPEASDHYFRNSNPSSTFSNANSSVYRTIMREWRSLEKNLPELIYVQVYETRIDLLRAVIIGAEGTPYHNGLFFFDFCLPYDYPRQPPKVYYRSHGLCLNPNLYADGKVCLSLINTWPGQKWTQNSTILQVLVSIQGLVLNERPFFNEPIIAGAKKSKSSIWIKQSVAYSKHVFILSCKTMLYLMRNPPKNFENFVAQHFRERADSILAAIKDYQENNLLVGSCSIKPSSSFKSKLRKIQSELEKAFGRVPEPSINKSEKLGDIKKPKRGLVNKFMMCIWNKD